MNPYLIGVRDRTKPASRGSSPLAILFALGVLAVACSSSETVDAAAEDAVTTEAPATTQAPTTEAPATTEAPTTEAPKAPDPGAKAATPSDDPVEAAMQAWSVVFDSTADWADKSPHLDNAEALESSAEAYATTGDTMGGISLQPSSAVVDGETATIAYDVFFGENAAYTDLEGTVVLIDGLWVVSEASFCEFLGSARTPCQT